MLVRAGFAAVQMVPDQATFCCVEQTLCGCAYQLVHDFHCAFLRSVSTQGLCMQVVQSLQSCFLYDTVSFLDEARFHRLLPMLVSQLAAQPPATVAEQLVVQHPHNDPFGQAVVAALVQMAVTANNDALWKSLNHQVCS